MAPGSPWRIPPSGRSPVSTTCAQRPAWPLTDNISHGELIRAGNDETMTVDPRNLRFVFQGALESEKAGIGYGQIPWRLGLLTPAG